MDTLRQGSRGFKVEFLQRLLNKASKRERATGSPLNEDGIFGPLTNAAVLAFQSRHKSLKLDGAVGIHTWKGLGLRNEKEHVQVTLVGQATNTTCWSAAASEILGNQSVGSGTASTSLGGGLVPTIDNLRAFASSLGWSILNYSPDAQSLTGLAMHGPLWIAAFGAHFKHAVVLSGVYSDGDHAGDGTMFRIHDPWPPGLLGGRIYGTFANSVAFLASNGVTRLPVTTLFVLVPR